MMKQLSAFYKALWSRFGGEPWTLIMRRHPYLLLVPAFTSLGAIFRFIPRQHWWRVLVIASSFGLGFLFGHVFW